MYRGGNHDPQGWGCGIILLIIMALLLIGGVGAIIKEIFAPIYR